MLVLLPIRIEITTAPVAAESTANASAREAQAKLASPPAEAEPAQAADAAAEAGVTAVSDVAGSAGAARQAQGALVEYTLKTGFGQNPQNFFVGVGGDIDGQVNPTLTADVGDTVRITMVNGVPLQHDLHLEAFGVASPIIQAQDQSVTVEFVADKPGEFEYHCMIPGHADTGMKGKLLISGEGPASAPAGDDHGMAAEHSSAPAAAPAVNPANPDAVSIVRNPADVPAPVGDRDPTTVRVDMTAVEVSGLLADGTTYSFFTFDGQIPGPMIRVRVGDTIDFHLKNADGSVYPHSIDLHAVTGPGGGAVFTQTVPGQETSFSFKALNAGLYVYHCATSSIPHHISNGMYGLILVEPPGGLPPVDREYYVMQAELYTEQPFGTQGDLTFSADKMSHEDPEYFTFNGAAGALTQDEFAMRANVGETVRIFFGVGGPNATSSLHLIGEIFDRVYDQASLTSNPLTDVQTTTVPPGGATMVEFKVEVPGRYILVDHALSRLERGLAAYLIADGDEQAEIFHSDMPANMAGH
ncbi:MAG: nitrite reductase, copper-containing [Anaerolineae bacterium]|nr:nitrite reductase, copper-containing [Anaerolineae bacterium]